MLVAKGDRIYGFSADGHVMVARAGVQKVDAYQLEVPAGQVYGVTDDRVAVMGSGNTAYLVTLPLTAGGKPICGMCPGRAGAPVLGARLAGGGNVAAGWPCAVRPVWRPCAHTAHGMAQRRTRAGTGGEMPVWRIKTQPSRRRVVQDREKLALPPSAWPSLGIPAAKLERCYAMMIGGTST